jgi:hypothetical protein
MAQAANPHDATPMIKMGAIAIIAFILLIFGSCAMVRCACGGRKDLVHYRCWKPDCPGRKPDQLKKAPPPT